MSGDDFSRKGCVSSNGGGGKNDVCKHSTGCAQQLPGVAEVSAVFAAEVCDRDAIRAGQEERSITAELEDERCRNPQWTTIILPRWREMQNSAQTAPSTEPSIRVFNVTSYQQLSVLCAEMLSKCSHYCCFWEINNAVRANTSYSTAQKLIHHSRQHFNLPPPKKKKGFAYIW